MFSHSSAVRHSCYAGSDRSGSCNGIDLIKFICAFLIFTIHIPPFQEPLSGAEESINFWLRNCLCRLAVPFYFVSSGFLLFRNMSFHAFDTDRIRNYCLKLLRLIGIWSILLANVEARHLWYLHATVVAVVLLSLCLRFRLRLPLIWAAACVLYAIGLLGDSYNGLTAIWADLPAFRLLSAGYSLFSHTTRNGIFMGFIFILMGAACSGQHVLLKPRTALAGPAGSMVCLLGEVYLLQRNQIPAEYNMYIFLLPATFFLFSFARALPLKDRPIYRKLRTLGTLIYFTHMLADHFITAAIVVIEKYGGISLSGFRFPISLLATVLLASGIEWLSRRKRYRFLGYLLS